MNETPKVCLNATVENLPVIGPTCSFCGLAPEAHGLTEPDWGQPPSGVPVVVTPAGAEDLERLVEP